jgi:Protein of unknown function (DUF4241)
MIPEHLDWVFEEGGLVRRRLADLVLPTGRVLMGCPGPPPVNEPSPVRPAVPPGRYPVWLMTTEGVPGPGGLAFVVVEFVPGRPAAWEEAGRFFTDSGTGWLMDESGVELLGRPEHYHPGWAEDFYALKAGVYEGGDGNLVLDPDSGANAVVFETFDAWYNCYLGKDEGGTIVCLVVDGLD